MIGHRQFEILAASVIDFALTDADRADLDGHLATCAACRDVAWRLRSDASAIADRPRHAPPVGMRERFEQVWLPRGPHRRGSRPLLILVAAAVVLAISAAAIVMVGARLSLPPPLPLPSPFAAVPTGAPPAPTIPPVGNVRSIAVPAGVAAHEHLCHVIVASDCAADVAIAAGSVWTTFSDGITRVNPTTDVIEAQIPVGAFPHRLVFAEGSVWIVLADPGALVRVDPDTNTIAANVPIDGHPIDAVWASGSIWVVDPSSNAVVRVDPGTNSVVATVPIPDSPRAIAADDMVWVAYGASGLSRIDPSTNLLSSSVELNGADAVGQMTTALDRLWVAGHDHVTVVDPRTGTRDEIVTPNMPTFAVDRDGLWVASSWNRTIQRFDPATLALVAQQTLGIDQSEWKAPVAVRGRSLWIRDYTRDRLLRVDLPR